MRRYLTSTELPLTDIYPKRTDGKCRKCEKKLTGRQTSWCSSACSDAAQEDVMIRRGSQQFMRIALRKRDKGICVGCGLDGPKLKRVIKHAQQSLIDLVGMRRWMEINTWLNEIAGFNVWSHVWEADHIVEVAAGGEHSLENLQTLCIRCHKAKTKRFVSKKPEKQKEALFSYA